MKNQRPAATRLKQFVEQFVLIINKERIKFNNQGKLPVSLSLKHEMNPTAGPLYQDFADGHSVPAFIHTKGKLTKGTAVWLEYKHAKAIAKIAGLKFEVC